MKALTKYLKKGADFSFHAQDEVGQAARSRLIHAALEKCVLNVPDWQAAASSWASGRPFEIYIDASDEA